MKPYANIARIGAERLRKAAKRRRKRDLVARAGGVRYPIPAAMWGKVHMREIGRLNDDAVAKLQQALNRAERDEWLRAVDINRSKLAQP